MAVIAAQTIDWGNPAIFPRSQGISIPTASMTLVPVVLSPVIPAPYVYNLVPPPTPVEAELVSLNEADVQILSL